MNIERFALHVGDLLLEMGFDSDCDQTLRGEMKVATGNDLLDDQSQEVVDGVVLWWREEDGDLTDALVDALTYLKQEGVIWLLTPKVGREGHMEPSDIHDAVSTAGLSETSNFVGAEDWGVTKVVQRKSKK